MSTTREIKSRSSRSRRRAGPVAVGAAVALVVGAMYAPPATADASSDWPNAATINIPEVGKAAPFPSSVTVAGATGVVAEVTVTLKDIDHEFVDDLDVLLVSPSGARVIVMSDAGGGHAHDVDLTLHDHAAKPLPDDGPLTSGTYKPTNMPGTPDSFDTPAPDASGAGSALATFVGTQPNGTWSLFVMDSRSPDSGHISGGWALHLTTATAPAAPVIKAPVSGSVLTTNTVVFTGSAPAGTTVRVLEGDLVKATTKATTESFWKASVTGVAAGSHTYTATATEPHGITSAKSAPVTIVVDAMAPSGTVLVNGGAVATRFAAVALRLSATDPAPGTGVGKMRLSSNGTDWSALEPYRTTRAWTLSPGDGTKTVYVQYADAAGNLSAVAQDSIVLDTLAPRVLATTPRARADGVRVRANVRATFGEPMRLSTLTRANVRLFDALGTRVRAAVRYDPALARVVIDPIGRLARDTTYRVVVGTFVRDLAGNRLDQRPERPGLQAKVWRFTTR